MAIMTRDTLKEYVIDELSANIVNVELDEANIDRNIDRALFLSSDYFTYTDFKTLSINQTSGMGGYINLKDIDSTGNGRPSIVEVYPTRTISNVEGSLLGLGSFYIQGVSDGLEGHMKTYGNMLNNLSQLDSIMGRGAKVVGDKLYVDKYYDKVTVEYIPNVIDIEQIHEGSWIMWIIDYTVALSKKQIAQARGKFIVDSNPFSTNAAELIEQANSDLERLEEILDTKGVLLVSR